MRMSNKPKNYHHGDLHSEILRVARVLLEENNIASLSLRTVAKMIGVSHTAPYRHFKNKEGLLAGIASQGYEELTEQLKAAVDSHPNQPALQLEEAGRRYVQLGLISPQCTQLMFGGVLPRDDRYPEFKVSSERAFDSLKKIIKSGQSNNVFKNDDPQILALAAWSGIHGLTMLLISGSIQEKIIMDVDLKPLISAITSTILTGLRI